MFSYYFYLIDIVFIYLSDIVILQLKFDTSTKTIVKFNLKIQGFNQLYALPNFFENVLFQGQLASPSEVTHLKPVSFFS